jgi:hypothetical protein
VTVSVTRDELDDAPEAPDPLEDAEPVGAPDPPVGAPVGEPVGAPAPCGGVDGALVDVVDAVGSVVQGCVGSVGTDALGTDVSTTVVLGLVELVLVSGDGNVVEMVDVVDVVGAQVGPTKAWV